MTTARYVRYVTSDSNENPWYSTGLLTQITILQRAKKLNSVEQPIVINFFRWLGRHVPCPPFSEMLGSGEWSDACVCWFRKSATEAIAKVQPLIKIAENHGFKVTIMTANYPGKIKYRDQYQIVADTPIKVGQRWWKEQELRKPN